MSNILLEQQFLKIIETNPNIRAIINQAHKLNLPNWYLGAGCLAQTVWNYYHQYKPDEHIKDYDLVYFDADLTKEKEERYQIHVNEFFKDLSIELDVINQARVHQWYRNYFGYDIKPYSSIDDAIRTWPTTSTAIALYRDSNHELKIIAPFGLNDLMNLTIKPNKAQITEEIYSKKVNRWSVLWPKLNIQRW